MLRALTISAAVVVAIGIVVAFQLDERLLRWWRDR